MLTYAPDCLGMAVAFGIRAISAYMEIDFVTLVWWSRVRTFEGSDIHKNN